MNMVFVEIGGNQGDRYNNINLAIELINKRIGQIEKSSSIYETPPWGFASEQWFYNQVLLVKTELTARQVLNASLQIEKKLGRIRKQQKYASRTMDIDILFYNHQVFDEPALEIPHPRMHLRRFVLQPLAEIASDFIHPQLNKSISELLSFCDDKSECKIVSGL